jgi:histidine phosphatase superfamily protein (branch 1)
MCPVRVVCLVDGGGAPEPAVVARLRGWRVCRVYGGPGAAAVGAALGVPVEAVDVPAADPGAVREWLLAGDLGETGTAVLERFRAAMDDIAARHRGDTVAVVSDAGTLGVGLAAMCRGLSPRRLREQPPRAGQPIPVEYDGEIWTALPV